MKIVNLIQGSPEWLTHRAQHLNASDAPAMMGVSSYKSRSDLIQELATGLVRVVDAATQRRFDDGHRFEALARPLAEEIIGDDLSPCVGTEGKYSASFDGLTFGQDDGFEHKSLNETLRAAFDDIETIAPEYRAGREAQSLPIEYQIQMEHQAMVAGTIKRILFMASKWDAEGNLMEERHCWYTPNLELRARIVAGWEQLEKDVAAWAPPAAAPAPSAKIHDALPALRIEATGTVTASNLDAFKTVVLERINGINTELTTDQHFADADADARFLRDVSDRMKLAGKAVRGNMQTVDDVLTMLEQLDQVATKRAIDLEKKVKAEKEARKLAIVATATNDFNAHIGALERRLEAIDGRPCRFPVIGPDFASATKSLKSLASMADKVAVELTDAKHRANLMANQLETNRKHLMQDGADWISLFADFATVGQKPTEDFQALAALRIGNHQREQAERLAAERARIRAEEEAKARAEAEAKLRAEQAQERAALMKQEQETQAAIAAAATSAAIAAPLADDLSGLVQEKAAEAVAGIDAQQVISAAKSSAAAADTGETMNLGAINARLAPIKLDAAGLAELGFEPVATVKASKLYAASDMARIIEVLGVHLAGLLEHA